MVAGIPVNYDEARVGTYTLPDPLALANGKPVRDAKTWTEKRRPEIVRLFEENEYGRSPGRPAGMTLRGVRQGTPAFDGKAIRKQVTVHFSADKAGPKMDLLLYLPAHAAEASALFAEQRFFRELEYGGRSGRPCRRSVGSGQKEDSRESRQEVWQDRRRPPAWTRGSASGRFITAISIRTFWAAFRTACARCILSRPDGACARRMGRDRRLGLGFEPRHGLSGDR